MDIAQLENESNVYEKFLRKITILDNGCWVLGRLGKYSKFRTTTSEKDWPIAGHRYSYQIHKGDIPNGKQIDHLCSEKSCCNPEHLEVVTASENTKRAWERGDAKLIPRETNLRILNLARELSRKKKLAATHCKRGHFYSLENTILIKTGGRDCKECRNLRRRVSFRRKP
jgi:hypothetical protein